jgi:hypothetical protein
MPLQTIINPGVVNDEINSDKYIKLRNSINGYKRIDLQSVPLNQHQNAQRIWN